MPLFQHWIRCSHFFPPKIGSTNSVKVFLYFQYMQLVFILILQQCRIVLSIFPSYFLALLLFLLCFRQFCAFVKLEPTFASSSQLILVFLQVPQLYLQLFPIRAARYMKVYAYVVVSVLLLLLFLFLHFRFLNKFSLVFPFLSNPYNYLEIHVLPSPVKMNNSSTTLSKK